jgi:hypothetical protein
MQNWAGSGPIGQELVEVFASEASAHPPASAKSSLE